MAGLQRAGIQAHIEIRDGESVLSVRRKIVSELHPAARAERKAVDISPLVAQGLEIVPTGELGLGLADSHPRRHPRRADVLVEERRGDAQGRGDIVETVHFDLAWQQVFGVDLHAQQVLHGNSVLGSRHALDRHVARNRTAGAAIERVLHPADELIDILLIGLTTSGWRHQAAAQFADGGCPRPLASSLMVSSVIRPKATPPA